MLQTMGIWLGISFALEHARGCALMYSFMIKKLFAFTPQVLLCSTLWQLQSPLHQYCH
jgi:hypothetical protein